MAEANYNFDQSDLDSIDKSLQLIKKACKDLSAFSQRKGGIPVIDRNVERLTAPLEILMSISEVLDIVKRNPDK